MIDTIIIPVLNRYDLLNRAVRSLPSERRIVVIDNGRGIDPQRGCDALNEYDGETHLLSMPTSLSVAASWNLGIKATPDATSGWLLLNSDAYFASEAAFIAYESEAEPDRIVLGGTPGWCCAFIGEDVVRRVGLFCERFHPAYMEDVDYQRRAMIHGITIIESPAIIHHDNSSTIKSDTRLAAKNTATHAENQVFYAYRWAQAGSNGLPPTHEWDLDTTRRLAW